MKLFVCAVALCLFAVSFCKDITPGGKCTKDDTCTLESECKKTDPYCPEMTCVCKESNKVVKGGKCEDAEKPKIMYDGTCTKTEECYSGLECNTDKKCKCPAAKKNYNKATMECTDKTLYDGDCTTVACYKDGTNMVCNTDKKCKCKDGMKNSNSDDKTCSMKDYAEADGDCSKKPCKDMLGFECKSNKCVCPDDTTAKDVWYVNEKLESVEAKKCLASNATVDAAKDAECSDTYEIYGSYCKKDLKCKSCGTSNENKCREKDPDTSGVGQTIFSMTVVLGCVALRKFFM